MICCTLGKRVLWAVVYGEDLMSQKILPIIRFKKDYANDMPIAPEQCFIAVSPEVGLTVSEVRKLLKKHAGKTKQQLSSVFNQVLIDKDRVGKKKDG